MLRREVKVDSHGLFIHYGGFRYRPQGETKATPTAHVLLHSPFRREDNLAVVSIGGKNETWKQGGTPRNEVPFFSKRIRLTDHCAGTRPDFGDVIMVTLVKH
jgi:hypothetical protein